MRYIKPDKINPELINRLFNAGRSLKVYLKSEFSMVPVIEEVLFEPYDDAVMIRNISRGYKEFISRSSAVKQVTKWKERGVIEKIEIIKEWGM